MTTILKKRDWPEFGAILCGTMTDRERLGLPDYYMTDRFSEHIGGIYDEVRQLNRDELLAVVQDGNTHLEKRLAVGNLLALIGDPRIVTKNPAMVDIPGSVAVIGLEETAVDDVLSRFCKLGLDETWIRKECPQHEVRLEDYRIGKFPVTNQEYRDFLVDTRYPEIPSSWAFRRFPVERANHPVYTLSAEACDAYARWLATETGRCFRLPTESEWEFAAAGPERREFPWGAEFDESLANTCETGLFDTSPVGIFHGGESRFSVYDMAGNVEEYVSDNYEPYPGGPVIDDHLSQIHGAYRVARGGSFARFRDLARTRRRHGHNPRSVTYAMGFRLAESIYPAQSLNRTLRFTIQKEI
ncbi:SUMF1/EgtB/PvdO family nonheme iron enzyme [Methylobacter sp.]|uniref:formylglycine-generating enzyme family protein n=1 Tax=Methylobacter sp. TaxID=2051955 RepID=UPI00248A49F7|nr:SUMF1/EgtB/PvdO family nonheme iron enzyme [Methylobacter sp.]MDI1278343.1 SUMF1/EgtB/PvdO family nonheme iron enzyme [Methylobacter sp.]MDI1359086.1 SUMF1/EgtB/PvdO family nonheme iron enzyme [Methylobacter sp.]